MFQLIRHAYYLSFPVLIGAMLSNKLASRLSDVEPVHWATAPVLGLVVWCIYTTDRLLDVRKPSPPTTSRHRFHRQHAGLLWRAVAGAAGLALVLSVWLPGRVFRFGLVLGAVCAAYVVGVYRLPARHPALLLKEPLVALLFAAGVWGSVWVQRSVVSAAFVAEGIMFAAIAFQNLLLFSWFETRETATTFSLATVWRSDTVDVVLRWLTFGVVAAALGICFAVTDRFAQRAALMLGIMSLVLYAMQRYPAYFSRNERYRWLGDGVFWLPALVL